MSWIHFVQRHGVRKVKIGHILREVGEGVGAVVFNRTSAVGSAQDSAVDVREGEGRESISKVCIESPAGAEEPDVTVLGCILDMFWVDFKSVLMDYRVESFHKALHCVVVVTIFNEENVLSNVFHVVTPISQGQKGPSRPVFAKKVAFSFGKKFRGSTITENRDVFGGPYEESNCYSFVN